MKPSTVKKIKAFKTQLEDICYKMMYPLAWILRKVGKFNRKRLKTKATLEVAAKLFAKEMYKDLCKDSLVGENNEERVYVAEEIDLDYYESVASLFTLYTKYNSKARRYGEALGVRKFNDEVCEKFIKQVVIEFDKLNEYTYAKRIVEDMSNRWGLRGYKFTCVFGVKEDVK